MGDAARKRAQKKSLWPSDEAFHGIIEIQYLPSVASINGARIRELTGSELFPVDATVTLNAYRATVGSRAFQVGFCLGDGQKFSGIGLAVIERLAMEAPKSPLHVVPIEHEDIAWDLVLRHLRTFKGQSLLFAFPNSDVYDAGTAETFYSEHIRKLDAQGVELVRPTELQRREIRERKAEILNRPPPPKFYPAGDVGQQDAPWIFRVATPAGKVIRTAVWNGRRNYAHELSEDVVRWVGGNKIAIVQVASPVGVDRRSSLLLTHCLAQDYEGVVHWAKDTETFQSIVRSFIRLDLESVSPPELPEDWEPAITILAANE